MINETETEEVQEEVEEATIWGQPSDIDWLAPATSVTEHEEMLTEDVATSIWDDIDTYSEDVSELELE